MSYYFLIALIIVFNVVGQLMLKYGISGCGEVSFSLKNLFFFLTKALTNIYIISGLALYFLAACSWLAVLAKIPLSRAYPFLVLSFALVVILSGYIFNETLTWLSWLGLILICLGIIFIGIK